MQPFGSSQCLKQAKHRKYVTGNKQGEQYHDQRLQCNLSALAVVDVFKKKNKPNKQKKNEDENNHKASKK